MKQTQKMKQVEFVYSKNYIKYMPDISLVINLDTRPENGVAEKMFSGAVSEDFMIEGIEGKKKFLQGFDFETICYVDKHLGIPPETVAYLQRVCDTLVIRKHTNEISFNCYNYLRALQMASGDIVIHADQDTNMFTSGKEYVQELINHLDNHKFVSYPSYWSPKPIEDPTFGSRTWASTRFFMCKKETLRFDELKMCISEPEYAYSKYGDSPRRCNWLEHFLTLCNGDDCFYPPIELQKGLIFSWGSYEKWVLRRLNELPYEEVVNWVASKGGVQYPVDVFC